jgi:hypothetical protein
MLEALEATSRPSCVRTSTKALAHLERGAISPMVKVRCANLLLLDGYLWPTACGGYSAYMWLNNTKTDDTHLSCNELCNHDASGRNFL